MRVSLAMRTIHTSILRRRSQTTFFVQVLRFCKLDFFAAFAIVVIVISLVRLGLCVLFDSFTLRDKLSLAIFSGNVVLLIKRCPLVVWHCNLQNADNSDSKYFELASLSGKYGKKLLILLIALVIVFAVHMLAHPLLLCFESVKGKNSFRNSMQR
jgi:hypothetical protein